MPDFFGPKEGFDSKDYVLQMQGPAIVDRPQNLIGHTMTNANVDLSDALKITRVELKRGQIRTFTVTKRAAEERGRSYTIGYPSGALWTPALAAAIKAGCRKTFFLKYLCPSDVRYSHVRILPDGVLSPPVPEGDFITVDGVNAITESSTLETPRQETLFILGYDLIYTLTSKVIGGIAFTTADCPGCADVPGLGLIATGGDGTAAASNIITPDRFASSTLPAGGGSAKYGTSVFTDGALVVIGYADKVSPAAGGGATAGGIYTSNNGGATLTAVAGLTLPVFGVTKLNDTLIAVGGTGAGAAKIWFSQNNGSSWTLYGGTLPAADALISVDADQAGSAAYAVGESGKLFKITAPGNTITLVDLSANLPATAGDLYVVRVLGDSHVIVGGASGYLAESTNGGKTWTKLTVTASAIKAIGGNRYRTLVGGGAVLYERSPLSDMQFQVVTLQGGVTVSGNYTAIEINVDDDYNLVAAATDIGEVVFGKGFMPNS